MVTGLPHCCRIERACRVYRWHVIIQIAWQRGHARTAHLCRFLELDVDPYLSAISEETGERQPAGVTVRPAYLPAPTRWSSRVVFAAAHGCAVGHASQGWPGRTGLNRTVMDTSAYPLDLPLGCRCGHMRGVASDVSPSSGFRFICYCKDCQVFARFLKRTDVLDPAGGTDIFQMAADRMKLISGMDALRCIRLSQKVLRWYGDCCRTPIANSAASPRFPVVGVIHCFIDYKTNDRSLDEALGPPLCRIYERSAVGPLPPNAPHPPSLGVLARRASRILRWWVRGRGRPTLFFDGRTKSPRAVPRVLTQSERGAV